MRFGITVCGFRLRGGPLFLLVAIPLVLAVAVAGYALRTAFLLAVLLVELLCRALCIAVVAAYRAARR